VRALGDEALGERLVAYLTRTRFYADPQDWTPPAAVNDESARRPSPPSPEQERLTRALAPLVHEKVEVLADIVPIAGWFFRPLAFSDEARDKLAGTAGAGRTLALAAERLSALEPYTVEGVEALVRALPEELGVKPKAVFAALRLGMSGQSVTPGLFESLWLLGHEEAAARLSQAVALID
jgi:glutamyl-tRNA synthetase